MLPSGWDSEEEELRVIKETEKREEEGGGGGGGKSLTSESHSKSSGKGSGGGGAAGGGGSNSKEPNAAANTTHDLLALAARRPIGGVWMAGYAMPGGREVEDVGEYARDMKEVFTRVATTCELLEQREMGEIVRGEAVKRRKRKISLVEEDGGLEVLGQEAEQVERPRLQRKPGAAAAGAGGGGGASARKGKKKARAVSSGDGGGDGGVDDGKIVKAEPVAGGGDVPPGTEPEEGDDMEIDEGGGELDEEDRELLGEVDADEDESEDDDDDGMED